MAAATGRVRVKGYRETMRALNRVDKATRKTMLDAMKHGAEPVALDARSRLAKYPGMSLSSIVPRAVSSGVYITQKHAKVTGKRPDFGVLQMQRGFIPAAEAGQEGIADVVDNAMGVLIAREGF